MLSQFLSFKRCAARRRKYAHIPSWFGLLFAAGLWLVAASSRLPAGESVDLDGWEDTLPGQSEEERAARRACTMCHLFVEPDMLTRKNWAEQILPRMKARLGVAKPDYASSPEGELIRSRKIYREEPMVPVTDWPLIERYYLDRAPEKAVPQDAKPEIQIGLRHFRADPPQVRLGPPTTSLVRIDPDKRRIFMGDDRSRQLLVLDGVSCRPVSSAPVGNVPVDITEREGGYYVTGLGSFIPTEYWIGELLYLEKDGVGFGNRQRILGELPRTTQSVFCDLNADGLEDVVLCMFGNLTGRFSWFEQLPEGGYREHVLTDHTGATRVVAHDFNRDGHPDLAVLFSQDLEMLVLLINDGKGGFTGETVFQESPVFGHSYFELADFNADGRMDLLVCSGDNGEYESPTKRYHGIRLWLDRGDLQFEQAWFYPMNGCYGVRARDFDEDGDLDIAAISYFPDYAAAPRESFVYLENQGGLEFKASTFKECVTGRWLLLDAGDIDADGDVDLVLGSYVLGPTEAPKPLMDLWEKRGAAVQILRNTLR
ncbi:MAG: hypothetical protein RI897_708 [Verrucomicrobiota bacterium]